MVEFGHMWPKFHSVILGSHCQVENHALTRLSSMKTWMHVSIFKFACSSFQAIGSSGIPPTHVRAMNLLSLFIAIPLSLRRVLPSALSCLACLHICIWNSIVSICSDEMCILVWSQSCPPWLGWRCCDDFPWFSMVDNFLYSLFFVLFFWALLTCFLALVLWHLLWLVLTCLCT